MKFIRLLLFSALALFTAACSDHKQRIEEKLRNGGGQKLRHEAALLYKDLFSGRGKLDFFEVWYKTWPESFQKLSPVHVGAYIDGFSIATEVSYRGESGVYVVPESIDNLPKQHEGTTFEKIADGIYWYSFGK